MVFKIFEPSAKHLEKNSKTHEDRTILTGKRTILSHFIRKLNSK